MILQEVNLVNQHHSRSSTPQSESEEGQMALQVEPDQEMPISNEVLQEAKIKLVKFIQNLKQHRKSALRADVIGHCEQLNKGKKIISAYISDETVLKMVSARIDKMIKNRKIKRNWSEDDIKILVWIISKYADLHGFTDLEKNILQEDWNNIAKLIPGVTAHSCMFRWLSIKKVNLSAQYWSPQESSLLRNIVQAQMAHSELHPNNLNWKFIAERQYKANLSQDKVFRSAKQCKQHWNCFLHPNIKKGPWKIEEDIQLLSLIRNSNGVKKWSQIVCSFEGRTENALKNRFTLLIDKQKKHSKSKQEKSLIEDCLERCCQEQALSTRQRKAVFISQILYPGQDNQKIEKFIRQEEVNESCEIQEFNRLDSQTVVETPTGSQVVIKFCTFEEFDALKKMAISNEVKPGFVMNGSFNPQL